MRPGRLEPLGSAAAMAAMADAALEANLLLAVPSAAAVRVRRATGTTAAGLLVGVDVAERVRRPARHDVLEPLHPLDGPRRRHVTQMPPVICAIRMTLRLLLLLKLLGRGRRIPAALLKQRVSLVVLDVVRRAQLRLALRGRLDHRKVFPRPAEARRAGLLERLVVNELGQAVAYVVLRGADATVEAVKKEGGGAGGRGKEKGERE